MTQNWSIPTSARDVFNGWEKRVTNEESRPSVRKASDVMGPGLGPFAIQVDSLDGDVAAFNAMWVAAPGTQGAPDDDRWWIGQSISSQADGGIQIASTFQTPDQPHKQMMRAWQVLPDGVTRAYSPWQEMGGGDAKFGRTIPFSGQIIEYTTGLPIYIRRSGIMVNVSGQGKAVSSALSGLNGASEVSKPLIGTLPTGYRPSSIQVFLSQGSGTDKWTYRGETDGTFYAYRYSPGTATTSSWLPFSVTFPTDDPEPTADAL